MLTSVGTSFFYRHVSIMANSRPPEPIAVSPATAAKMIDCSRQHIYQLIERGEIRRCKVSGSKAVRIPLVDLYAVLGVDMPAGGRAS